VGGALGLAILAAVATGTTDNAMTAAHGAKSAVPAALTSGFQDAFMVGAGFAVFGALMAWLLIRTRDSRAHVSADPASVPAA